MEIIVIAVIIAFIAFLWIYISILNNLAQHAAQVNQSIGTMAAQYQQRANLIPDACHAAKAAVRAQREYFDNLLAVRKGLISNIQIADLGSVPPDFVPVVMAGQAASNSRSVSESNPTMNVEAYTELQRIMLSTEKDVTAARRFHWAAVAEYNAAIHSFPAIIIANLHGYKSMPNQVITPELEKKPDYDIYASPA
jgi:LemA protein